MGLILVRANVRYTLTGERKSTTESNMFLTDANLLFIIKALSRSFRLASLTFLEGRLTIEEAANTAIISVNKLTALGSPPSLIETSESLAEPAEGNGTLRSEGLR